MPDDRTVIAGGDDLDGHQMVVLRDLEDGVRTATLEDDGSYRAMVSDRDGTRLAASAKGAVRFWDLDPEQAAARICAALGRSLTQAEWDEFLPGQPYRATCG